MKTRTLIIISCIIISSTILILFYGIQNYEEPFRKSTLDLRFEKDVIIVLIRDETHVSINYTELTTIPISSLVKAHDKLPMTSMNDRIIAGSIVSETEKSGTYLTEDGFKEFWYTIDDRNDYGIITIELQNHEFDRIVFDSEKSQELIDKINEIVYDFKQIPNVTTEDPSIDNELVETQIAKNPEICSGWELCISGKMDEIIDGDTIRINRGDNYLLSTSFALSFAPELDEEGGKEAKQFLETVCPIGSKVLIDQDGSYPFDRYHGNMILSEVHCNGVNLNQALVESEHGHIGIGYCKNSEFRDRDWAIDNGCPKYDEVGN